MSKIIWCGNMNWDSVWDKNTRWMKEISKQTVSTSAVKFDRPDDIVKAAVPYMIVPMLLCIVIVFLKRNTSSEFIFDFRFVPVSVILGFMIGLPFHEFLHAVCYPKHAKVYIGVSLQQLRAFAVSATALSRERYIMMSLAPMIPGIIALLVFLITPVSEKWLMTICTFPMFMGLLTPGPDYLDVILLLKNVPAGAMIQPTEDGLVWYQK